MLRLSYLTPDRSCIVQPSDFSRPLSASAPKQDAQSLNIHKFTKPEHRKFAGEILNVGNRAVAVKFANKAAKHNGIKPNLTFFGDGSHRDLVGCGGYAVVYRHYKQYGIW